MKGAITHAVKETNFVKIWDEHKQDLGRLFDQIKACKNGSIFDFLATYV